MREYCWDQCWGKVGRKGGREEERTGGEKEADCRLPTWPAFQVVRRFRVILTCRQKLHHYGCKSISPWRQAAPGKVGLPQVRLCFWAKAIPEESRPLTNIFGQHCGGNPGDWGILALIPEAGSGQHMKCVHYRKHQNSLRLLELNSCPRFPLCPSAHCYLCKVLSLFNFDCREMARALSLLSPACRHIFPALEISH